MTNFAKKPPHRLYFETDFCLTDSKRRWLCNLIFLTSEDKFTIPDNVLFGPMDNFMHLRSFNTSKYLSMLRAENSEFCLLRFVKEAKRTLGYFFSAMIIVTNTKQVFSRQKPTRYANCGAFLLRERSVFFVVFFKFSPT